MGGNALKIPTRRVDSMEYVMIDHDVSMVLLDNNIICYTTKSFEAKETFGDLDVLVSTESFANSDDMYDFIVKNYNPKDVHRNKRVISFEFRDFQVDFILIDKECFEISKVYYSYNDLGNFMGRIASNMGFRYGHEGLRLDYSSPHMSKQLTIVISRDPREIFAFLGFDYSVFQNGFEDLDDIFNYVIYSKFFTKNIYEYSMLNHQNKTRNRKRVNYRKFLDRIMDENTIMPPNFEFPKIDWIAEAEKFFNIDIKTQIEEFDANILAEKRLDKTAERLNKEVIQENFDIKGKELGNAITMFKKQVEIEHNSTWQEFVNTNNVETIMKYFGKYNNLNNKKKI